MLVAAAAGAASGDHQAVVEGTTPSQSQRSEYMDVVAGDDKSESLSDIDDLEVNGYLHNEKEKRYKKIIWEVMNREYLKEQAADAASKEAYAAHFQNCSVDLLAAQELAAAAVAKSRKERQQKRTAKAKNAASAQSAAEAAHQMLTKKRLSSKINYHVLDTLVDDSKAFENTRKKRIEPDSSDDVSVQQHIKRKKEESDLVDNDDDIGTEVEYGEEDNAGGTYDDDLYYGNEEEEGYVYDEDYSYE